MKTTFALSFLLIAQAYGNGLRGLEECPVGKGVTCPSNIEKVACGHRYRCVYDNDCLANAAGFVSCLRVEDECPVGVGVTCPMNIEKVVCGSGSDKCVYDNKCLANAAGYSESRCRPLDKCPRPEKGHYCQTDYSPVVCDGKCQYDNMCLANMAGFSTMSCVEPPTPCNPTTGADCDKVLPPPCNPTTGANC